MKLSDMQNFILQKAEREREGNKYAEFSEPSLAFVSNDEAIDFVLEPLQQKMKGIESFNV